MLGMLGLPLPLDPLDPLMFERDQQRARSDERPGDQAENQRQIRLP